MFPIANSRATNLVTNWHKKQLNYILAFQVGTKKTSTGSGAEVFKKLTSGFPGFSSIIRMAFWSPVFIGIIIFLRYQIQNKKNRS
jgi:hypothetical protein